VLLFVFVFQKNSKTKMEATAMNDFLQQLHDLVPAFDVASIPRDATGVFASPVHIVAEMLNLKLETIKKIPEISANVNLNCTRMKVIVSGTKQRNTIMVGTVVSIMRVLASSKRPDITAIVARLPAIAPAQQAPGVEQVLQELSVVPAPRAPSVNVPARPQRLVAPIPQALSVNVPARPPPSVAPAPQAAFAPAPVHMQQIKKPLVLNGMVIEVDPVTSMVNATQMCRAGGKLYANYSSTAEMTEFVQTLSFNIGIPILDLVKSTPGGNHSGTWVHRRVAMYLAQRISPLFNVQVTGYLDELLLTGRVELGKEKTPEELDAIFNRRIAEQQADVNNAFLREKNCLELSLLRIECSKRQRDDAAAEEERVAKRKRDDAAAEEDIVAKRARRLRDDAVADDKAKEESRMQLVRFDAEMAANAILTAEDLKLKRLKVNERQSNCAKNLIDLQANFMPKLTSCLQPSLYVNARLRSAMNDIEVNLAHKINKCLIGDDCKASGEASGYQETLYCNDFQTFLREMGFPMATTSQLSALGAFVSKKYKEANNNTKPEKTMKIVNNTNCQVNTYKIEHKDFIEKCIREHYGQSTDVPVAKPPKDMRSFFGVVNGNVSISCEK